MIGFIPSYVQKSFTNSKSLLRIKCACSFNAYKPDPFKLGLMRQAQKKKKKKLETNSNLCQWYIYIYILLDVRGKWHFKNVEGIKDIIKTIRKLYGDRY